MTRFETLFNRHEAAGTHPLLAQLVLGDPNPIDHVAVVDALIQAGADGLVLGLPFSDPAGITPPIQAGHHRALEAGVDGASAFGLLGTIRERHPEVPLVLVAFANMVVSGPEEAFYERLAQIGVDGLLIPDVPVREGGPFVDLAKANGMDQVFLAPPVGDETTLAGVATQSGGFIGVMHPGEVGQDSPFNPFDRTVTTLQRLGAKPCLAMTGTADKTFAAQVVAQWAVGLVSGDEFVAAIGQNLEEGRTRPGLMTELATITQSLIEGLNATGT